MKTLRCTFEMEIDVQFENSVAVENYFVHGDWKKSFYTHADLEEVAAHLAECFHTESDRWDSTRMVFYRQVEGYGNYYKQVDGSYNVCEEAVREIGSGITIKYELELSHAGTFEV